MKPSEVGIIFDCDGTLLNSMGMWYRMQKVLIDKSGGALTMEHLASLNSCGVEGFAKEFHERFNIGKSTEDVLEWINNFAIGFYTNEVELRPGVGKLLESLAANGVHMSVATASPHNFIDPALERTSIVDYFDAVLTVDDSGKAKESPDIFNQCQKLMGTSLHSTWGVEDSVYALKTLNKAGFKTLAVYDNDICGTWQELAANSNVAVHNFNEVNLDTFLNA